MKTFAKLALFAGLVLGCVCITNCASAKRGPLKALIVTGQNNHNWQVSHKALQLILEQSDMFVCDIAQTPPKGGDMSTFSPRFEEYDVVVLDYNGDRWSKQTDEAFLSYVKAGGGVVVYHAADNAFAEWEEFNRIIALGGWEGRNEKSGPYYYLRDGEVVKDNSPGPGGSHGAQREYPMNCRNLSHPSQKGYPTDGFTLKMRCTTVCVDLPTSRICSTQAMPTPQREAQAVRSRSSSPLTTAKPASSTLCLATAGLRSTITPLCSARASKRFCSEAQNGQLRAK